MTHLTAINSGQAVDRSTMVSTFTYFVNIYSIFDKRSCTFRGPIMYVWTVTHGVVYFNLVIGNLPLFYGCHSISLTGITSSYDIMYIFL